MRSESSGFCKVSSSLVILGLLVEIVSLLWFHPLSFVLFAFVGVTLMGLGIAVYLFSLVFAAFPVAAEPRMKFQGRNSVTDVVRAQSETMSLGVTLGNVSPLRRQELGFAKDLKAESRSPVFAGRAAEVRMYRGTSVGIPFLIPAIAWQEELCRDKSEFSSHWSP